MSDTAIARAHAVLEELLTPEGVEFCELRDAVLRDQPALGRGWASRVTRLWVTQQMNADRADFSTPLNKWVKTC